MASQDSNDKMNMIMKVLSDCDHEKVARTVNRLRDNHPELSQKELAQKFINGSAFKNGLKGGLAGASAGLTLLAAAPILGADLVRSLKAQTFLLHCIAKIYDQDPRDSITQVHHMVLASSSSFDEILAEVNSIFHEDFIRDLILGTLIRITNFKSTQTINNAFGSKVSQIAAKVAVDVLGRKVADFTMKGLQKHLVKLFWNVGGKRIAQQAAQKAIGKAIPVVGAVAAFGMDWHSLQQKGKLAIQYYESGIPVIINSLATTKPPKLELISEGIKPNKSIIYIRGFLTGHHREDDDWIHKIRMSGWFGNIYRFCWDSGDIGIFEKYQSSRQVTRFFMSIKWRKHRQNSKLMGLYYLPELVRDSELFNADSITFVTHSLGTDLLQYALEVWPSNHSLERDLPRIERCVLMGGVSSSQYSTWLEFLNKFSCSFSYKQKPTFLLNLHNKTDNHLLITLPFGDGFSNLKPVGLYEIELFSPHLKNIDCSEFIASEHEGLEYLSVLAHYKSLQDPIKPKRRKGKPSKSKDLAAVKTLESSESTDTTKKKHVNSLWDSFCQNSHKFFTWLFKPT